ncbi:MAG: GNAT family N-acetyltransferase [Lachnospiraceae bacterium]|jgi:UDP-4-amino-4,6-dideoxy-N-acetyl-beta-L-altrosamine N-acetyltransferase|nr:GNAT family N-acetyltransferase [Lachnospiraceae bacterium]
MTNEVTIRPITYDDTEDIIRWRNSDFVRSRFIDQRLFTKESHEYWLKNFVETGKVAQFIILLDGKGVGSVYLRDIDPDERSAEYGIFIGEESARGKGVGTKSARLILEYAFCELKLEKIFLRVYKDNAGAVKSYEKAGFVSNGKIENIEVNGEKRDVIFMELEKKDFEKR